MKAVAACTARAVSTSMVLFVTVRDGCDGHQATLLGSGH
jgi:hypothetical protein